MGGGADSQYRWCRKGLGLSCTVDARADGANADSQTVAGILACGLTVRGGGCVVVSGAGAATGLDCYGVRLLDEGAGLGADGGTLVVDASWLDASGTDAGVACDRGSLVTARLVTPAGGAFGDVGVVDVDGAVAAHVAIEPEGAIDPAGESGARDVTGDGGATAGEPATRPGAEATDVPAGATTKTTTVATTVTTTSAKTTVTKPSRPNASTTTTTKTPQNRRQPLDRPILGTFPAWNSACVRGPGQRFSLRLTRVGSLLGMRGEDTLAAINRVRGSCRQMANTSRIPLTFAPEATLKLEGFDVSRFPGTASQIFMPG